MGATPPARICRAIRLRQFRNFAELDLELPADGVAIIGDNGSGKTNFIEAVYYLEIFRSFRGASDEQLVRFGGDAFHLRGRFQGAGEAEGDEITAAFERRSRRKRVTVDGVEPERLGDALGRVAAVVFSPSDSALVAGAPSERRRFLDIVLSLNRTGYLDALQRYRQVLRQRNATLRRGAAPDALSAWDDGLVKWGAAVMARRAEWVRQRCDVFGGLYSAISGGDTARMVYRPSVPVPDGWDAGEPSMAPLEEAFAGELARVAVREWERGMTLVGPHRDDLGLLGESGGRSLDLREYGSGGQQRTAAVVLRLVEADTVRASRGVQPLILLDDLFAELDPGRAARILELLEAAEGGQVILTAPKATDLEPRRGSLVRWSIAGGQILT